MAESRRRGDVGHHLDRPGPVLCEVETWRAHSQDGRTPVEAAHGLNRRSLGILLFLWIELHEHFVAAKRRDSPDENGGNHDREYLADEGLFFRMKEEASPRFAREGRLRLDETDHPVLVEERLLRLVRGAKVREDLRDEVAGVLLAALLVETVECVKAVLVARIMPHASGEVRRIFFGERGARRGGCRRDVGEVDVDCDVRACVFELYLEILDASFECLDATFERLGARVRGRDERLDALRTWLRVGQVLDDDSVSRLVRGLERALQLVETHPIQAEVVGHFVELFALFDGDDTVLDDLRKELFVHRLELAETHVARYFPRFEPCLVLERHVGFGHEISLKNARASFTAAAWWNPRAKHRQSPPFPQVMLARRSSDGGRRSRMAGDRKKMVTTATNLFLIAKIP